MKHARVAVASVALAVAGGAFAVPAVAEDGFNATVAGQRAFTPLVSLVQSSTQTVDVVNLPAGVGLYALHCKVPSDPRSAPTLCDASTGAAAYLPATGEARATATMPIKVNAEFFGTNPNPQAASAAGQSVDCRVDTGDPRSTTCAVYLLGAGKDSANPAYLRVWPTVFSPVSGTRVNDAASVRVDGEVVKRGTTPRLAIDQAVPFAVTLTSGLAASISADNCSVAGGEITALKDRGTCVVQITSTGGRFYRPLVTTQAFRLTK